jgi:hypothetical protein
MDATWSSKTSANFQRTTRRYIPKDRTYFLNISNCKHCFCLRRAYSIPWNNAITSLAGNLAYVGSGGGIWN